MIEFNIALDPTSYPITIGCTMPLHIVTDGCFSFNSLVAMLMICFIQLHTKLMGLNPT